MSETEPLPDNAIEVRGLKKTYAGSRKSPPKTALKGVDLVVPRGSMFGLLGPNGAGKSTLINILAGITRKTSGKAVIWGRDIDERPRDARAALGVVAQEITADVFFTPREALETQAGFYGVPKDERRSDELLAALGHHAGDRSARLADQPDEFACLVGRDAAADHEQDARALTGHGRSSCSTAKKGQGEP